MTISKNGLPDGWKLIRLKDTLLALETGKRPRGGAFGVTRGVPSLSAEHMNNDGGFKFETLRYVPREFYSKMPRGHIQKNDILIVKDGATTGKVVFVDEDFPFEEAVINEHVFLCRPNPDIVEPRFLFLWLWGANGQKGIKKSYQGAAIGGINTRFVNNIFIPLPPLDTQLRISQVFKEKNAVLRQAVSATETQLEAVNALPGALLRAIFNNANSQLWPFNQLGEYNKLLPAKSISSSGDTEVFAITTACLNEVGFDPRGIKKARMWTNDISLCRVSKGEILVARSNTPELVGRAAMFNGEPKGVVASDLTIRVWPSKEHYHPQFLASYLVFVYLSGYWRERAGGASGSMKKITRKQLLNVSIPTPALDEQQKIVAHIDNKLKEVAKIKVALDVQWGLLKKLPEALLKQAFRGEL